MLVILWAFAASGFWIGGSHQPFVYPDRATCERDRPRIEREMVDHGYTGIFTVCRGGK